MKESNQAVLQFYRPKNFIKIHRLQCLLNSLIFDDHFDECKVKNVFIKSKRYGAWKAERNGLFVELTWITPKHIKTTFHYALWPDNFYDQKLFLRSLFSFICADQPDYEAPNDAIMAINDVTQWPQTHPLQKMSKVKSK